MNAAHVHLIFNHLPFAFLFVAMFALAAGLIGKNGSIKKFSLGIVCLAALAGVGTFFSGRATESQFFGKGSPNQEYVERHEDAANTAFVFLLISGAVGGLGLVFGRRLDDLPTFVVVVSGAVMLVCFFFVIKATNLGAQIRHSEIRADSISKVLSPGS